MAALTRQHFEHLARIVGTAEGAAYVGMSHDLSLAVRLFCKLYNPAFDSTKFCEAVEKHADAVVTQYHKEHSDA